MAIHDRILGVLGAFSADRPSLSLSEISRATGLPIGTAHRIVSQLVDWGALERDERRRYVIGLKLFEIGALAPRAYRRRERILPFLEELFQATRENVMLTVLDGHEAVMVEHVVGHRAVTIAAGLGERLPLHASAAGHVMLAFGPGDVLDHVLASPLPAYTRHTVTEPAALRLAVSEVRRTRIAVSRSAIALEAISIAAPIFAERGQFAGAVSIVTTVHTTDVTAFAPAVARTAQRISAALEQPERSVYRPLRRGRVRHRGVNIRVAGSGRYRAGMASNPPPRAPAERRRDTRARLERDVDLWIATADPHGAPYLIPLSFDWDGEAIFLATPTASRTARNLAVSPTARLALGHTRDVVLVDGRAELLPLDARSTADAAAFAARAGFDPRDADAEYVWIRVAPTRIQAWREVEELAARDLLRDGAWLD